MVGGGVGGWLTPTTYIQLAGAGSINCATIGPSRVSALCVAERSGTINTVMSPLSSSPEFTFHPEGIYIGF